MLRRHLRLRAVQSALRASKPCRDSFCIDQAVCPRRSARHRSGRGGLVWWDWSRPAGCRCSANNCVDLDTLVFFMSLLRRRRGEESLAYCGHTLVFLGAWVRNTEQLPRWENMGSMFMNVHSLGQVPHLDESLQLLNEEFKAAGRRPLHLPPLEFGTFQVCACASLISMYVHKQHCA